MNNNFDDARSLFKFIIEMLLKKLQILSQIIE